MKGHTFFPRGDYNEIVTIHRTLKIHVCKTCGPISTKLGARYLCVKGNQDFMNNQ